MTGRRRGRDDRDLTPWVKGIGLAVLLALLCWLLYLLGSFVWGRLNTIKRSYQRFGRLPAVRSHGWGEGESNRGGTISRGLSSFTSGSVKGPPLPKSRGPGEGGPPFLPGAVGRLIP